MVLTGSAALAPGHNAVDPKTPACAAKFLTHTAVVSQFVFKAYEKPDDSGCLQVFRNGNLVFRRSSDAMQYTLGQSGSREYRIPKIENGADVTGRGRPEMIVSYWTGGAHCCFVHYVFELEPEFKLVATLNDEDGDLAHFASFDDHHYYYLSDDWAFAYWPSCFACSPYHSVILRFVEDNDAGSFHLALDKMRRPTPSPAEWNRKLREFEATQGNRVPDEIGLTLWSTVLDLIYTGHSDLAWKFLDQAKAKAKPELRNSMDLGGFCSILKTSLYWPDLAPTLKNTPPACANAKPGRKR